MLTASPTKLRNGTWGARVESESAKSGDEVTIRTRAGKEWIARIERVVWSGNGVAIVSTVSAPRGGSSRRPARASNGECICGACEDLMSMGYRAGARIRCEECGGWAEAC